MKRGLISAGLISFCCGVLLSVEAQQGKKRPPAAASLDGKCTGKTEQGRVITFTVLNGRITEFSAEGRFQGLGCSTTLSTTTTLNQTIANRTFSFNAPGGPGGGDCEPSPPSSKPTASTGTRAAGLS